ncbi:MAG: hypothetical protein RLZZ66_1299 [Pseudomonadota bacterium]|jgi:hypothetical protein
MTTTADEQQASAAVVTSTLDSKKVDAVDTKSQVATEVEKTDSQDDIDAEEDASDEEQQDASTPKEGEEKKEEKKKPIKLKKPSKGKIIQWMLQNWLKALIILLIAIALFFLGRYLWKRYGDYVKSWWHELIRKPDIQYNVLTKVWIEFKQTIPFGMRNKVKQYPVYVVMGDARAGKSEVIHKFLNIDIQAQRYHNSDTSDSLLQIYVGNNSIVLEISSGFIFSTSSDHAEALIRLWRMLPLSTQIVMVMNVSGIVRPDEDEQNGVLNAMMAKIALFSELSEFNVPFKIVLTHMENVNGFHSFANTIDSQNMDVCVDLKKDQLIPSSNDGLESYFQYINNYLVSSDVQSFEEILDFLNVINNAFYTLDKHIKSASGKSELKQIKWTQVSFFSGDQMSGSSLRKANNPFFYEKNSFTNVQYYSHKHAKRAVCFAMILILLDVAVFMDEKTALDEVHDVITKISVIDNSQYVTDVHSVIDSLYQDDVEIFAHIHFLHLFDQYFHDQSKQLKEDFVHSIRTYHLLPAIELAKHQEYPFSRSIRLLALIHANYTNQLSKYFKDEHPEDGLSIPYQMMQDYMKFNVITNDPQMQSLDNLDCCKFEYSWNGVFPWRDMSDQLTVAMKKTYLNRTELAELQRVANIFLTISNRFENFPQLDKQRNWLEKNGHVSLTTRADWKKVPSQTQLTFKPLQDAMRFIMEKNLDIEQSPTNIRDCLIKIQQLITAHKSFTESNRLGIIKIDLNDKVLMFDSNAWANLILRSKIKNLLDNYYKQNTPVNGWIFFDQVNLSVKIPIGTSIDLTGSLSNAFAVDERLTREKFDNNVKPTIALLAEIVPLLPIDSIEKQRLVDFVIQNLGFYAAQYTAAYWEFFSSMQINFSGEEQLEQYLKELQSPNSALFRNLQAIKENVLLDIPPGPNFQVFREQLDSFRFIRKLMEEQNGTFPQFQRYIQIITDINLEFSGQRVDIAPVDPAKPSMGAGLRRTLSPMGRIAFDILLNTNTSSLRNLNTFLRELTIPVNWQGPFLSPIYRLLELGTVELNESIETNWKENWDLMIQPIMTKFPFDESQGMEGESIEIEKLTALFHPTTGEYWQLINSTYRSLFVVKDNNWTLNPILGNKLKLPITMIEKLNATSSLTSTLWNADGTPRAIVFEVKPDLLAIPPQETSDGDMAHASMSYLRIADSTVLGFNQSLSWYKLNYEWWNMNTANVGIEFTSTGVSSKKYASIDIENSNWSIYKLLAQADNKHHTQYSWTVTHPYLMANKINLGYEFKKDPFELFKKIKNLK